ncbi:MAG: winged helix-turn-helix domain-containing protein [Candidatus Jordarchaeaceae archaeon]
MAKLGVSSSQCRASSPRLKDFVAFYPLHKKNRSCFEIIASILECVKERGLVQFSLMKRASVSYAQFRKYLNFLIEIGFICKEVDGGRVVYKTSDRGLAFLRQYYALQDMLFENHMYREAINITYRVR